MCTKVNLINFENSYGPENSLFHNITHMFCIVRENRTLVRLIKLFPSLFSDLISPNERIFKTYAKIILYSFINNILLLVLKMNFYVFLFGKII